MSDKQHLIDMPFSVTTLAERWDVCRQTIHNRIKDEKIKNAFKVGNMYRIPIWEVRRIESCGIESPSLSEVDTMPEEAQEIVQNGGHSGQHPWMWQDEG